ncbi:MAG: anti-sigma factor family protein [Ktedonobacterales bacterium]
MQREISRNHTSDWDEQRERLSAYLDGELDGGEREALEQHLPACEQCQRTLDEFREVRALLRAMPMPATPRSFAIPTEGAIPVPLAAATSDRAGRAVQQQRRTRGGGGLWSGVAQAVGGFVAAAGVILVLGSALTGTMQHQFSASMPASRSVGSGASQSGQYDNTSTASGAHPSPTTTADLQQATPKAVEQNKGTPTPTTGTTVEPTHAAQSHPENPPVVPIGAGMVAGGTVLFVAGRVSGNRRRRT